MKHYRDLHAAMCQGKMRFRTWALADRSMRTVISRTPKGDDKMSVYRCRFCTDFHFGHDRSKK